MRLTVALSKIEMETHLEQSILSESQASLFGTLMMITL